MRGEIESTGRFAVEEVPFEFESYRPEEWRLTIGEEEAECAFAVCSANTPRDGVSAPLRRSDSPDLEGAVGLLSISGVHESIAVEEMAKKGAVAAVAFQEGGPMLVGRVRYPRSSIPCLMVDARLGRALWEKTRGNAPEVRMTLRAETLEARGRNLYAVPRDARPEALFVAHRDSRPLSPGAIDNASGSAFLLFLAAGSRNPRFGLLSTDAEEYGLLGARAFVRAGGRVDKGADVFNLDSIGTGALHQVERSRAGPLSEALNAKVKAFGEGVGVTLQTLTTPRGSDSDVFAEAGHRACWLRSYPTPTATTVEDTVSHLQAAALQECCTLLKALVEKGFTS